MFVEMLLKPAISGFDRRARAVTIAPHCASYMWAFMIWQKLSLFSQMNYQIQEICQRIEDIWSKGLDVFRGV